MEAQVYKSLLHLKTLQRTKLTTQSTQSKKIIISSDNKFIYSTSEDGIIKKIDIKKKESYIICENNSIINTIVLERKNKYIFSGDENGLIKKWDIENGNYEIIGKLENRVNVLILNKDCKFLFSGSENFIKKWDLENFEFVTIGRVENNVNSLVLGENEKFIFSASNCKFVIKWNLVNKEKDFYEKNNFLVFNLILNEKKKALYFISENEIKQVYVVDKKSSILFKNESGILFFILSNDKKFIFFFDEDKKIKRLNLNSKKVDVIGKEVKFINSFLLSENNKFLYTASEFIFKWNLDTDENYNIFAESEETINSIIISKDKKSFFTAGNDKKIKKWHIKTNENQIIINSDHLINKIKLSSDEKYIFSAEEKLIKKWDLKTKKHIIIGKHESRINSLILTKNNKYLFSAGYDKIIKKWNLKTFNFSIIGKHDSFIYTMAISKNNNFLFSGGDDKIIKKWDLKKNTSQIIGKHESSVNTLVLTREDNFLFSAGYDKTILKWNLRNNECSFIGKNDSYIYKLILSNNGKFLFSSGNDHCIKKFNLDNGFSEVIGRHESFIKNFVLGEKEVYLFSIGGDRVIKKFNVFCEKKNFFYLDLFPDFFYLKKSDEEFLEVLKRSFFKEKIYQIDYTILNIFSICAIFNFSKSLKFALKKFIDFYPISLDEDIDGNIVSPILIALENGFYEIVKIIIENFVINFPKKNFYLSEKEFFKLINCDVKNIKDIIPLFFIKITNYSEFDKKLLKKNYNFPYDFNFSFFVTHQLSQKNLDFLIYNKKENFQILENESNFLNNTLNEDIELDFITDKNSSSENRPLLANEKKNNLTGINLNKNNLEEKQNNFQEKNKIGDLKKVYFYRSLGPLTENILSGRFFKFFEILKNSENPKILNSPFSLMINLLYKKYQWLFFLNLLIFTLHIIFYVLSNIFSKIKYLYLTDLIFITILFFWRLLAYKSNKKLYLSKPDNITDFLIITISVTNFFFYFSDENLKIKNILFLIGITINYFRFLSLLIIIKKINLFIKSIFEIIKLLLPLIFLILLTLSIFSLMFLKTTRNLNKIEEYKHFIFSGFSNHFEIENLNFLSFFIIFLSSFLGGYIMNNFGISIMVNNYNNLIKHANFYFIKKRASLLEEIFFIIKYLKVWEKNENSVEGKFLFFAIDSEFEKENFGFVKKKEKNYFFELSEKLDFAKFEREKINEAVKDRNSGFFKEKEILKNEIDYLKNQNISLEKNVMSLENKLDNIMEFLQNSQIK